MRNFPDAKQSGTAISAAIHLVFRRNEKGGGKGELPINYNNCSVRVQGSA